jgi:hypothetical protein
VEIAQLDEAFRIQEGRGKVDREAYRRRREALIHELDKGHGGIESGP